MLQALDAVEKVLQYRTVAIVGLSRSAEKDSYKVAEFLKSKGYRIIPINPNAEEILGEKAYSSLKDLPENLKASIEVVDIFRKSEDVPPIVEEAVEIRKKYGRLKAIWMQEGVVNKEAAQAAEDAGLIVIMDRCMMKERLKREEMLELKL
ncbi:MAG: CoA-binding protein [Thaumarchaeota archaeon]|nr:CoA-binding protein [Nitrososphaerota archaeon]